MQTHRYRFPATGTFKSMEDMEDCAKTLGRALDGDRTLDNDETYSLLSADLFPSVSQIFVRMEFEADEDYNVKALNLHTYEAVNWNETGRHLAECLNENLSAISYNNIEVDSKMEDKGLDGEFPAKLYHITERANATDIMENGIKPAIGEHRYKVNEDTVFLSEEQHLGVWFSILSSMDVKDPVVFEVDTEGLDIKWGRAFNDPSFAKGYYGEFQSADTIPSSSIRQMSRDEYAPVIRNGIEKMVRDYKEYTDAVEGTWKDMDKFDLSTTGHNVDRGMEKIRAGIKGAITHGIMEHDDLSRFMSAYVGRDLPWEKGAWETYNEEDFDFSVSCMQCEDKGKGLE